MDRGWTGVVFAPKNTKKSSKKVAKRRKTVCNGLKTHFWAEIVARDSFFRLFLGLFLIFFLEI